ncbi:MAG: VWA domain-containing protein [Dehalococcoidia bacterium]|nr:MAG: VWA domain-containing protein [Dehalococcoidia bacterium]
MPLAYRYSEWDGTQSIPGLDADKVIEALSDDIMNFGDLQHALRNLMQRGMRNQQGDRMQGLRDLLQKLRQQRRERLDQFDLGGVMEDIKRQLEEILQLERDTLQDRLSGERPQGILDGSQPNSGDQQDSSAPRGEQQQGQRGQQAPQGQRGERGQQQATDGMDGGEDATDDGQPGQGDRPSSMGQRGQQGQRGQRQRGSQPGQGAQPGDADGTESNSGQPSGGSDPEQQFREMLQRIAERKQQFLEGLPNDAPGQMKALQDYEFLNPEAQHKFQELVDQLRQAMTGQFFKDVQKMVEEMSDGDKQRMKDMVRALNDMLAQKMRGQEPDFDSFMEQFGDMFGDNPPQSLEELMAQMQAQMQAMQSLMASMPGDQRQQLQDMLAQHLGDPELEDEISQLAQNLEFLNPNRGDPSSYPFRGDEEVGLEQAMRLMNEMHNMDDLENDLERAQYNGDLDTVDIDQLRELLGDDSAEQFEELKKLLEVLEQAGYVRREGDEWKLTPRGTRMIGQTALGEIYKQLKKQGLGNHPAPESGRHGERLDESKPYEFGDPFHLDMRKTLMNAIERGGRGTPVKLDPGDFEINRSELVTTTTTVLMVDLSWSMALRGSFQAAKKVALALQNLIKAQYPKDSLYIIGFSAYARELKPHELPYVRWDESVLGTNMHHALMLAERLLARHRVGTKQILMISDGEPTAHLENGRSQFAYPPSPITIRETLKAVKRVTQQEITINTFMLDRNYYLKEFVNQLAKINGGRVFYTTPEKLGEYLLVDYVAHKRKHLTGR